MNRIFETNFFYVEMANLTNEQLIAFGFWFFIVGVILIHVSKVLFRAASIVLSFIEPVLNEFAELVKTYISFANFCFKGVSASSKSTTTKYAVSQPMAVRVSSSKTIHRSSVTEIDEEMMAIPAYARKDADKHYPIYS